MDRADNEQANHRMNTMFHTVTSAKNKIRKSRVRGWSAELYHMRTSSQFSCSRVAG